MVHGIGDSRVHADDAGLTDGSAEEVVVNFKRDLSSTPAKKIHTDLKALELPTVSDLRDEFEEKARKLGVNA